MPPLDLAATRHDTLRDHLAFIPGCLRGTYPLSEPGGSRCPPLDEIREAFDLDDLDMDLLSLALSFELDPECERALWSLHDAEDRPSLTPTFAAVWPGPAARGRLHGNSALFREGLFEWQSDRPWQRRSFGVTERVLQHLLGGPELAPSLRSALRRLSSEGNVAPAHAAIASRLAATLLTDRDASVWHIIGSDPSALASVCGEVASRLGRAALRLSTEQAPTDPAMVDPWWTQIRREVRLLRGLLVIDGDAPHSDLRRALACAPRPTLLSSTHRAPRIVGARRVEVPCLDEAVVRARLADAMRGDAERSEIDRLTAEFRLGSAALEHVVSELRASSVPPEARREFAWDLCRDVARPDLEELAQRIEGVAALDDLVLPPSQVLALRELCAQMRQRHTVHRAWAMGRDGARGLGVSALFSGPSGTGKTTAAEAIARELRMDLYRVDLSAMVSKYIGETEKNLRRVFDAAEGGGAVLLFDEADALFGKRSEVKDSHDRYANLEVSYLLQRMEAFRGLAILTTNLRGHLDTAFLRRLRFVVDFPFPDAAQREALWRKAFPAAVPTENINHRALARLQITGGTIRNMALHAAFLAADAGEPVRMRHLLAGALREYEKLERPLTQTEMQWFGA